MESQDELLQKVRLCMTRNIAKLAIAMLLIGIITSFIVSFSMTPVAVSIIFGNLSTASLASFLFFSILINAITYILQYGFFVLVLFLYRNQQAVLGHLFTGFRDFKRAFLVGLVFTLISVIVMFIFAFILSFGMASVLVARREPINYRDNMTFVMSVLLGVVLIVLAVMYLRYGFVWFIMIDQPDLKVREAFKQSAVLTKGKRLNFILFCIKSAGLFLLIGLIAFIVMQVLPSSNNSDEISPILYMTSSFVNMAYLLCVCVCIIRVCIAYAAWYTAYYASYTDSQSVIDTARDTIIHLPDSRPSDSTTVDESKNSEE